jgi:hypothetical protein
LQSEGKNSQSNPSRLFRERAVEVGENTRACSR